LGAIVGNYKSVTTRRINRLRGMPGTPFWQRNYWEHIIRNDASLNRIRAYIRDNPARWTEDRLHPDTAHW
jgi:REP element-mobilizing transposase RayT